MFLSQIHFKLNTSQMNTLDIHSPPQMILLPVSPSLWMALALIAEITLTLPFPSPLTFDLHAGYIQNRSWIYLPISLPPTSASPFLLPLAFVIEFYHWYSPFHFPPSPVRSSYSKRPFKNCKQHHSASTRWTSQWLPVVFQLKPIQGPLCSSHTGPLSAPRSTHIPF